MMKFRIAHLLWLIAACAVYLGLVRWCDKLGADDLFETWLLPLAIMGSGKILIEVPFGWLPTVYRQDNRRASEEFVEQYTSGRNVRIER